MGTLAEILDLPLEQLAAEINAEHRAFYGTLRKSVEHGIRAGKLLAAAKEQTKHGEWLPWLRANFEGAPRTAQEYMRLYIHRDELREMMQSAQRPSISGALRQLAAPSVEEEEAILREQTEGDAIDRVIDTVSQFAKEALEFDPDHLGKYAKARARSKVKRGELTQEQADAELAEIHAAATRTRDWLREYYKTLKAALENQTEE